MGMPCPSVEAGRKSEASRPRQTISVGVLISTLTGFKSLSREKKNLLSSLPIDHCRMRFFPSFPPIISGQQVSNGQHTSYQSLPQDEIYCRI